MVCFRPTSIFMAEGRFEPLVSAMYHISSVVNCFLLIFLPQLRNARIKFEHDGEKRYVHGSIEKDVSLCLVKSGRIYQMGGI